MLVTDHQRGIALHGHRAIVRGHLVGIDDAVVDHLVFNPVVATLEQIRRNDVLGCVADR